MSVERGWSDRPDEAPARPDDPIPDTGSAARRLVEIRCGFAEMARREADSAQARVVEAWAVYDRQTAAVTRAQAEIDLAGVRASKEEAHRTFRAAISSAQSRGRVEAAAANWLAEINRVNGGYRLAQARVQRELEAAESLLAELTRLSDAAEAGGTMADAAMQACQEARAALAAVGSGEALEAAPPPVPAPVAPASPPLPPEAPMPTAVLAVSKAAEEALPPDGLVVDIRAPGPQLIVRLVRRDGKAIRTIVDSLAGSDPPVRSRWQLLLSTFVDALVAAAIDDAWFEFPAGHPFWAQFHGDQAREVARNLAAVGFRYDGFGAFLDGRVPDQRALAMAVGGSGLQPARVRVWPKPEEAAVLFRDVHIAADQFVAARAPALTLGQLLPLLGRRAELLADLWNEWPRVRPLLFATHP